MCRGGGLVGRREGCEIVWFVGSQKGCFSKGLIGGRLILCK